MATAFSVMLSVFLVAVAVYGATTIDTITVGVGTTTAGAAVSVKGAGLYEGFVHADYFKSTSTNPSWLFGNLGIGTTTPGAAVAVDGAGIFDGFVSAGYFTSTSTNTSWLFGNLGIGTTTPGTAVAVDGAATFDGFVGANYFTSTSSLDSWLLGGLGLGTTTVSDTLNADGSLAIEGAVIVGNNLVTSFLKATSTTATSTISGYGLTVASTTFNVDGVTGAVSIGTTTFPDADVANTGTVDPAFTVSGIGNADNATGTIFLTNEAAGGGGQIILRSTDGAGCISITATRGATGIGGTVGLTTKIVACPK